MFFSEKQNNNSCSIVIIGMDIINMMDKFEVCRISRELKSWHHTAKGSS